MGFNSGFKGLKFVLTGVLSCRLCLGLPGDISPSHLPIQFLFSLLIAALRATYSAHLIIPTIKNSDCPYDNRFSLRARHPF